MNTLIIGIECAKDHAGNHSLFRAGKFAECAGCGEYYTLAEIDSAEQQSQMLTRGVKRTPAKTNPDAK